MPPEEAKTGFMSHSYLQVINPIIGLAINVLVQVGCSRYIPSLALLKSVVLGFVSGLFSLLIFEFYLSFSFSITTKDLLPILVTNCIIYALLGYCYFHFINLGETARRIRILRELCDSEKGLSLEELLERYNAKDMIDMRLRRLLDNGQIIYKDGRYFIGKPVMLLMAKIILLMKLIVLGKKSEFD